MLFRINSLTASLFLVISSFGLYAPVQADLYKSINDRSPYHIGNIRNAYTLFLPADGFAKQLVNRNDCINNSHSNKYCSHRLHGYDELVAQTSPVAPAASVAPAAPIAPLAPPVAEGADIAEGADAAEGFPVAPAITEYPAIFSAPIAAPTPMTPPDPDDSDATK